jgi:4-aminobutyrate aminotransferase-like enzyme
VNLDPSVAEVPFPGDMRTENKDFSLFEETLEKNGVTPDQVAGVIFETFQGGSSAFMPKEYAKKLRQWCDKHDVVMILDEVQAGFGRTGKMFGFEHYDIVPDLITCGKATTSSLPLSIVLGKSKIMNITDPVSSTHTGNPVCVAAAMANIETIIKDKLAENAAEVGAHFKKELEKIKDEYPDIVGSVDGEGLVFGMQITEKGSKDPDGLLAFDIVRTCVEKGVMMFSPVGTGGATIKICPPLVITKEAVDDGVSALREAFKECVK